MPNVSKPFHAPRRKRLASALALIALSASLGACGNDEQSADTATLRATEHPTATRFNASDSATPADPASPTLTIQTPAAPASDASTSLSATAPPLATPVIHTVD
ncbi:hypothetical protein [Paraburkholderia antibiotica]|uniref:Lipoprotein n=1 Tax=Paraburkholderia antibiotica TaxID=2728839 RepID=A0A7X9ZV32_9BURK|nr:hypothetical protein [Paraburkholderia antibiotica]NML29724.1 hypothetical protein [Paraburkholderia antibiotica]